MGKFKKIYVLAPFGFATGGVELAHQLVDHLRKKGQNAFIVYVERDAKISSNQTVTKEYETYNIVTSSKVEDEKDNLIVLTVHSSVFDSRTDFGRTWYIYNFCNIKIACWWMSVDNHYSSACVYDRLRFNPSISNTINIVKKCFVG